MMAPDKQQELLKRCLALQLKVGWPEWDTALHKRLFHWEAYWSIQQRLRVDGDWHETRERPCNHEALCLWQDHLLGWLVARDELLTIQQNTAFGPRWSFQVESYEIVFADTLIEAILDVCEQIQQGSDCNPEVCCACGKQRMLMSTDIDTGEVWCLQCLQAAAPDVKATSIRKVVDDA